VPQQPRQRVEILARPDPHLLVGQAAEGALGRRVHEGVLAEEQITSVYLALPECGVAASLTFALPLLI
jgi:hypothetical protein